MCRPFENLATMQAHIWFVLETNRKYKCKMWTLELYPLRGKVLLSTSYDWVLVLNPKMTLVGLDNGSQMLLLVILGILLIKINNNSNAIYQASQSETRKKRPCSSMSTIPIFTWGTDIVNNDYVPVAAFLKWQIQPTNPSEIEICLNVTFLPTWLGN